MNTARTNLSLLSALVSALVGLLLIPAGASAAAVRATPAIAWPGASLRLEVSGFAPRARGTARLSGVRTISFRVDGRGGATLVMSLPRSTSGARRTLRIRAGGRVVSTTLLVADERRATSTMVALSGGARVLLDPASGRAGARFFVRATGFPRRATVDVRFGGERVARRRANASGASTIAGSVPRVEPGGRVVRVRSGRTNVGLRFQVLESPPVPPGSATPSPRLPPQPPAPAPGERTPPTVSLTAPASGTTISIGDSVAVTATASDNVGVNGVQFRLDGNALGSEYTTPPYSTTWSTTGVSPGDHTLTAVARDAAGNTATSNAVTVRLVDKTPPTVTITVPRSGATVGGTRVPVIATASDNVGVSSVQFRRNTSGTALGTDTSAPYSIRWNVSQLGNGGSHMLTAVATDAAGNSAASSSVSVTVDNTSRTIATAGDIACSPSDLNFNGGLGSPFSCGQMATSNLVLDMGYSDVLTLGDTQYDCPTAADFAGSFHPSWGRVKSLIRPATGNHEYKCDASAAAYFDYFGAAAGDRSKGYYSFDIGSWHIIALNTNLANVTACPYVSCAAGSAQEQWLRADLLANPTQCTLAFWHHPLFASKPAGVSQATRPFWDALQQFGAEIVLNGHTHNYERFNPQRPDGAADSNGIAQFIVGSGGVGQESTGAPVANSAAAAKTFGVLELTLKGGGYDWRFVTAEGQPTFNDSGSASCH